MVTGPEMFYAVKCCWPFAVDFSSEKVFRFLGNGSEFKLQGTAKERESFQVVMNIQQEFNMSTYNNG